MVTLPDGERNGLCPTKSKPTQKGLTVNVATLPKLIGLLQEAEAKARAEGLIE